MHISQAYELLADPNYAGRLGMEDFEKLLLRAGYSPDTAHTAAKQRGWDRLTAGEAL